MSITYPSESIWLPGAGELRFDELAAARLVEEYDADLTLGQIRDTGQWAVFLPREDGTPFPVLGLGRDLPPLDRLKELLYRNDVRRNGRRILAEMEEWADAEDKRFAEKVDAATEELSEAIASHMQSEGTHPFPKIYVGGKRKKGNVRSAD